jgi:hypothetical protein
MFGLEKLQSLFIRHLYLAEREVLCDYFCHFRLYCRNLFVCGEIERGPAVFERGRFADLALQAAR